MKNQRRFWIVEESVEAYIKDTLKKSEGFLLELEAYAKEFNVPIMTKETAEFIKTVGLIKKPKNILEIGTAIGYSAITFCEFLQDDGHIETIELKPEMVMKARENIKKMGLSNKITVIAGNAIDVLNNIDKKYDMIFIDAAKGQYEAFYDLCAHMVKDDGIIISDNVLYRGMVAKGVKVPKNKKHLVNKLDKFLKKTIEDERFQSSIMSIGDGVCLSYRKVKENE